MMRPVSKAADSMPPPKADTAAPSKARSAKPPSIEDVAHAAAVSTATVSRFLNTPQMVAPNTAERIRKVIADLGYRPNRFAQGLMTRRSHVIGIVLPDIHGEFYSELLRGATAEARGRGYHLLVAGSDMSDEPEEGLRSGPMGLIDGVAVMITEPNERLWRSMTDSGLPMVALDANPNGGTVDSVLIDNIAGAAEATEHLLQSIPPERCFFVGGPADNFDTKQRAAAFMGVLERHGRPPRSDQASFGAYSAEWGRTWASRWLKNRDASRNGRIGVLAGNDEVAMGVMDVFQSAGVSVPRDARLVGFDDSRLASLLKPSISSVRVPRAEVGAAAVAALIERIEHPEGAVISRTLPTRLVVRESSAS